MTRIRLARPPRHRGCSTASAWTITKSATTAGPSAAFTRMGSIGRARVARPNGVAASTGRSPAGGAERGILECREAHGVSPGDITRRRTPCVPLWP
jgi:hypothetical protein